jgi:uncharacterized protein YeaO (DUF488 family)
MLLRDIRRPSTRRLKGRSYSSVARIASSACASLVEDITSVWEAAMIKLKRVYEPPEGADGTRFLVERLWPRGMRREALSLDGWLKDVAPSDALRRWFGHDPSRFQEFHRRYAAELDARPDAWRPILAADSQGTVTLLYSAHDTEHNSAVALRAYLKAHRAE